MSEVILVNDPPLELIEIAGDTIIEVAPTAEIVELDGSSIVEVTDSTTIIEVIDGALLEVVEVGSTGPEGPAGTPEDEVMLAKRVDFIANSDDLYRGEADVGTLDAEPLWRIRLIQIAADGDVTETWAGGTAAYDKIWNDRASLSYT